MPDDDNNSAVAIARTRMTVSFSGSDRNGSAMALFLPKSLFRCCAAKKAECADSELRFVAWASRHFVAGWKSEPHRASFLGTAAWLLAVDTFTGCWRVAAPLQRVPTPGRSYSRRPGMFLFVGGHNKLRLRYLRFEAVDLRSSFWEYVAPSRIASLQFLKHGTVFCCLLSVPRNFSIITHVRSRFALVLP